MKRSRLFLAIIGGAIAAAFAVIGYATQRIETSSAPALAADLEHLPHERVALVLGCSPVLRSGEPNRYFDNRIAAAVTLFRARKIDYLLVSGDNHVATYDEPTAMKQALVKAGVPEDRIVLDYAGFSTLDSIIRARTVFGLSDFCIVTQKEHALRAIYIAQANRLHVVAFCAKDVPTLTGLRTRARESLARVRALLDVHLVHRQPHFQGPRIEIGRRG